jgi:hypothetical protein
VTRRILNALAVVSLVLCAAIGALWVDSYFHYARYEPYWRQAIVSVGSSEGGIILRFNSRFPKISDIENLLGWHYGSPNPVARVWTRLRAPWRTFSYDHKIMRYPAPTPPDSVWELAFPHWSLCLLFAILPATRIMAIRRRSQRSRGHCGVCGYDLRATPDRCPECGTIPSTATADSTLQKCAK